MRLSCELIARRELGEPQRVSGGEMYYRCPQHDDRHPSLKINISKNVFLCGPCNASGGAWAFAAWLAHVGANEKKAVGAWLTGHGFARENKPVAHEAKREMEIEWREVVAFLYTPILRNMRFEAVVENGQKPQKKFQWQNLDNGKWVPGAGGQHKPLYMNHLMREADQPDMAVGFEGEAKADLAGKFDIPAFSYKVLDEEECIKLAGLEVILWPDADHPGIKQMNDAAELMHQSGHPRMIRKVTVPLEMPVGGDIVDAVRDLGWGREQMMNLFRSAIKYPPAPKSIGVRMSEVVERRPEWLWRNRIPSGAIAILDGDPGAGKSTLALDIAARVSTGGTLPDSDSGEVGNVVVLSAEDDLAATVRPRLRLAGANLENITAIQTSSNDPADECFVRLPRDLKVLEQAMEQMGSVKLVILDVFTAYMPPELSTNKDQDVRHALAPMSALANRTGAAFLLLRHLNKNVGTAAIYRGGGSVAITGAARASLLLARDQINPDERTLAVVKSNLGPIPQSVNLKILSLPDGMSKIEWCGLNDQTAEDLLGSQSVANTPEQRAQTQVKDQAAEWLEEILAGGAMKADDVKEAARDNCISRRALESATAILGIKFYKEGFGGKWWWEMKKRQF